MMMVTLRAMLLLRQTLPEKKKMAAAGAAISQHG